MGYGWAFVPRRTVSVIKYGHFGLSLWVGPKDEGSEVLIDRAFLHL